VILSGCMRLRSPRTQMTLGASARARARPAAVPPRALRRLRRAELRLPWPLQSHAPANIQQANRDGPLLENSALDTRIIADELDDRRSASLPGPRQIVLPFLHGVIPLQSAVQLLARSSACDQCVPLADVLRASGASLAHPFLGADTVKLQESVRQSSCYKYPTERTVAASAATFPPAMQLPRRPPQSLSLGSLGDSSRLP